MKYTSQSLQISSKEIVYYNGTFKREVMMDWEHDLMSASAAYITQNGGDILEIGFGMGISAGYIQSHSILSHTIVENHPDIIPLALQWAEEKQNVSIVTGSWYDNLQNLQTYDGVFYDTYGDEHMKYFSSSLAQLVKTGGVTTWWNNLYEEKNIHNIKNTEYTSIEVTPAKNSYFNNNKYYLPRKQF